MLFSKIFLLGATALGVLVSGVNGDEYADITLDIFGSEADKGTVEATKDDLDKMIGEEIVEAIESTEGPSRGRRDRKLVVVEVLEGEFQTSIVSGDEVVNITYKSVSYVERTVDCEPYGINAPICFQIGLAYRARITAGNFDHNVDDLLLPYVKPEWKEAARELLRQHIINMYGSLGFNPFVQVRVDGNFHISTWGDPHFKTFSGGWYGKKNV